MDIQARLKRLEQDHSATLQQALAHEQEAQKLRVQAVQMEGAAAAFQEMAAELAKEQAEIDKAAAATTERQLSLVADEALPEVTESL